MKKGNNRYSLNMNDWFHYWYLSFHTFQKNPFDENCGETSISDPRTNSIKEKSKSEKRKTRYQVNPISSDSPKYRAWNDPCFNKASPESFSRSNRNLIRAEEDSESCSCTSCRCELCLSEQNLVSLSDPYLFFTPKLKPQTSSNSPRGKSI